VILAASIITAMCNSSEARSTSESSVKLLSDYTAQNPEDSHLQEEKYFELNNSKHWVESVMYGVQGRNLEEQVVAYWKVLSQHLSLSTEEHHRNPQTGQLFYRAEI
jgi:hypothetical protein